MANQLIDQEKVADAIAAAINRCIADRAELLLEDRVKNVRSGVEILGATIRFSVSEYVDANADVSADNTVRLLAESLAYSIVSFFNNAAYSSYIDPLLVRSDD